MIRNYLDKKIGAMKRLPCSSIFHVCRGLAGPTVETGTRRRFIILEINRFEQVRSGEDARTLAGLRTVLIRRVQGGVSAWRLKPARFRYCVVNCQTVTTA